MPRRVPVPVVLVVLLLLAGACVRESPVAPSSAPRASVRDTAFRDRTVSASVRRPAAGGFDAIAPDSSCPEPLRGSVIRCRRWSAGNGHWYAVVPAKAYFTDAVSSAAGLASIDGAVAHLATLTSAEELAFVLQEVLANLAQPTPEDAPLDAYWLGATAEENRGDRSDTWRWTTSEVWQYTAWDAGEPNNGNETALSLWGAFSGRSFGTWNNLLPGPIPDNDLHRVWSLVEWEGATPSDTCSVAVTNYKQTDPRWSAVRMDSRILPGDTLGTVGCTVTALSIVFSHAGLSVDPPTMNRWLVERRGFTPKGLVEYPLSSREGSAGLLRFVDMERQLRSGDELAKKQAVSGAVCRGLPVIATVKNYTGSRGSHAVVITRAPRNVDASTPWADFGISDPGYRRRFTLFDYDTAGPIRVRGHVTPTAAMPSSPSSVSNSGEGSSAVTSDLRDFGVVIENGSGVLTDVLGRRLGQLAEAEVEYKEIPNSSFDPFLEPGRLTDTLGGNEPPSGTSVGFSLGVDIASSYVLAVRAASTGQVSLMLHDDLSRRNIYVWSGIAGQTYRFTLLYDPAPTARLIVQRTDAGAPRPYQLTALCGTRFRVRNRSDYTVTATWDVYGTTERGTLQLPPRASETEFSETIFSTVARGTVRLVVGGQQVDVKAPSNAACTN